MGRVILLGTGDPLNGERAQTSLAVPFDGDEVMLIDASSGTILLRQLEAAGIPLQSVRHLFITHRHFDHVGGFAPLLTALVALPESSITVHATPETLSALRGLLTLTIPGVEGWLDERLGWSKLTPGRAAGIENTEVTPFEVDHGLECVGFRINRGGSVMTFATDTRPCENVVEYSRGANLLLHEAYGTRGDAKQAHFLGHSTAAEAGWAARAAGVRHLLLTHLRAARFAEPESLRAEAEAAFGGAVDVALDLDAFDF